MAATGAAVLTAAGCGGGTTTSPGDAASKMAQPTAAFSKPPAFAKMRFSTHMYACEPKADSEVDGSWETNAPRYRVKPGSPVKLGLSNSGGTPVQAVVYNQRGGHAVAKATAKNSWSDVVYPDDFVSAKGNKKVKSYKTGIYTVVWTTQQGNKFISCDGFATVGAKEPKIHKPSSEKTDTPSSEKPSPGASGSEKPSPMSSKTG